MFAGPHQPIIRGKRYAVDPKKKGKRWPRLTGSQHDLLQTRRPLTPLPDKTAPDSTYRRHKKIVKEKIKGVVWMKRGWGELASGRQGAAEEAGLAEKEVVEGRQRCKKNMSRISRCQGNRGESK